MIKTTQILLKDTGKGNIHKNNLSLKALQAELAALKEAQKTQSTHNAEVAGHDIKGSYINRVYMKSSALALWLLTLGLSYGHKLPFISKVVALLSLWYGKTSWWKMLVYTRKVFVLFNALIGVYMVFKSVGFSTDNIIAGFYGIGHTYLEMFYSLTRRLFNWFVELFDYKVIPNVPNNQKGPTVDEIHRILTQIPPRPPKPEPFFSLRSLYDTPINLTIDSNPWYKDWNNWLWIAGIAGGVLILYFGYKVMFDPLISSNVNDSTPTGRDIELNDNRTSINSDISNGIIGMVGFIASKINPLNYFYSQSELDYQFKAFMDVQNDMNKADRSLYPFTINNPYLPWYKKWKLAIFGESSSELSLRNNAKLKAELPMLDILSKGKEVNYHISGHVTPIVSSIGFNPQLEGTSNTVWDVVHAVNVENNLKSIPQTPVTLPGTSEWSSEAANKFVESNSPPTELNDHPPVSDKIRSVKKAHAASSELSPND